MGVDRFGIPAANVSAPLSVATTAQVEPPLAMPRTPSMAVPTTPQYRPLAESPPTIYRCRSKGTTTYSNEPCPGGSVVNESSAVIGYDTRPSDRMARLVAEGRVADVPQPPVYRTLAPTASSTPDCNSMRRQIRDIDAQALRPNDFKTLDDLRAVRQDIRTSMARLHC